MFKEQMNKIKDKFFKKKEGEEAKIDKRKIENLVAFLIILIITLIAINAILGSNGKETKEEDNSYKVLAGVKDNDSKDSDYDLEKRLENILKTINGVRERKCFDYIYSIK